MGLALGLLWLLGGFLRGAHGQGVYGKTPARGGVTRRDVTVDAKRAAAAAT